MSNVANWGYLAEPVDGRMWKVSFLTLDEHHELKEYPGVPVRQDVLLDVHTAKNLVGVTKDFTWYNYAEDLKDFLVVTSLLLDDLTYLKESIAYFGTGISRRGMVWRIQGHKPSVTRADVNNILVRTLDLYPKIKFLFGDLDLETEHEEDMSYCLCWADNVHPSVMLNVWADLGRAVDLWDLIPYDTDDDPDDADDGDTD